MSVEIEHVDKFYGKNQVLKDINMNIKSTGCYAILGPNGAGKTTLFRVISTLIRPDSGSVRINGYDLFREREKALENVGFLVSVPEPPDFMTVREFIQFSAKLKGKNANLEDLNQKLDLPDFKARCGKLSKGQKRRVYLAAILAQDPQIMVLDEPTDGLDPIEIYRVKNVIKSIKKDKIILYSSHILSEIVDMCDYVYIMNKGRIIYHNNIVNIQKVFRSRVVRVEFDYPVRKEELKKTLFGYAISITVDGNKADIEYDGTSKSRRELMLKLLEKYEVISFYDNTNSLEEAFVKILGVFGDKA